MATSYWVRRAGLPGFLGPMELTALQRAVELGDISLRAEARVAAGDGKPEVLDGTGWIGVHELLGLAPPPPLLPPLPTLALAQVRQGVRRNSAYRSVRKWLALALLPFFALACLPLIEVCLVAFGNHRDAPRLTFGFVGMKSAEFYFLLALPLVAWNLARALFDIADCHLLQRAERAPR